MTQLRLKANLKGFCIFSQTYETIYQGYSRKDSNDFLKEFSSLHDYLYFLVQ